MSQDNSEIAVAVTATLSMAPAGTAQPVTPDEALNVAFVDVGRTTEDGTGINLSPTWLKIFSHQANKPTKQVKQREEMVLNIVLQQWNGANLKSLLGGGTIADVTGHAGVTRFDPPAENVSEPAIAVLDMTGDEGYHYRFVLVKVLGTSPTQLPINKTKEMQLALALDVQDNDAGSDWYLLTDDPNFIADAA